MHNKVIRLYVKRKLTGKYPVDKMRQALRDHKLVAGYCKKYLGGVIHPTVKRAVIENGINFFMRGLPKHI